MDDVSDRVSPNDKMLAGDFAHYMSVGRSALTAIDHAMALAEIHPRDIGAVLDLPCGHGRILRWLRRRFPSAAITASDLDVDGMKFCALEFGAQPLVSHVSPRDIRLGAKYDLIWSGSLLTHLPEASALAFLEVFFDGLAPGGILVFTVHGRKVAERITTARSDYGLGDRARELISGVGAGQFVFVPHQHGGAYGISLSLPPWVTQVVCGRADMRLVSYTEAGWDHHQDVVVCQKDR